MQGRPVVMVLVVVIVGSVKMHIQGVIPYLHRAILEMTVGAMIRYVE